MRIEYDGLTTLFVCVGFSFLVFSGTSYGQGFPPVPVASSLVSTERVPDTLQGIAVLEARQQILLSAEAAGRITKINFQSGDSVAAGDLLLQLNDNEEVAKLQQLRAQLRLAKSQLQRSESLKELAATRATIDEEKARIEILEADISGVEALIRKKQIYAPFPGMLGIKRVHLGQYLGAGDQVVSLTDNTGYYLNITFPEEAIQDVAIGQLINFSVDAFPNELFNGRIRTIEPIIDSTDHTIHVQAEAFGNESGSLQHLRPGLFSRASIIKSGSKKSLVIPELAVIRFSYGDQVYVVSGGNAGQDELPVIEARTVEVGREWQGKVEILSGLKEGERIVTHGQNRIRPGSTVAPTADE